MCGTDLVVFVVHVLSSVLGVLWGHTRVSHFGALDTK